MSAQVDVLGLMAHVEQIGRHARIAVTADGDIAAARRAFERIANKLEGAAEARAAFAELIAADKEYDEAREALRKLERDLSASGAAIDAAIDRIEAATARRASALAAVGQQS